MYVVINTKSERFVRLIYWLKFWKINQLFETQIMEIKKNKMYSVCLVCKYCMHINMWFYW